MVFDHLPHLCHRQFEVKMIDDHLKILINFQIESSKWEWSFVVNWMKRWIQLRCLSLVPLTRNWNITIHTFFNEASKNVRWNLLCRLGMWAAAAIDTIKQKVTNFIILVKFVWVFKSYRIYTNENVSRLEKIKFNHFLIMNNLIKDFDSKWLVLIDGPQITIDLKNLWVLLFLHKTSPALNEWLKSCCTMYIAGSFMIAACFAFNVIGMINFEPIKYFR